MKSKFGREIVLLTLPVLIFGGVTWWQSRRGARDVEMALPPASKSSGQLKILSWKAVAPSTVDYARGISSRWVAMTQHSGACPVTGKLPFYGGMRYPTRLYFAWKRGGKWHSTPFKHEESELDVMNLWKRDKPIRHEVRLGLPLDLVPSDAEEVRLRGRLDGWMMCQSGSVEVPGAPLDFSLLAPGQVRPTFAGSRVSPLKFVGAKQSWGSQRNGATINPSWEVESGFSYTGKSTKNTVSAAHTWVEDAGNKWVSDIGTTSWGPYPNSGNFKSGDMSNPIWQVDTRKLKEQQGPFTLESWVYVEKNEWPLRVSIPLNVAE